MTVHPSMGLGNEEGGKLGWTWGSHEEHRGPQHPRPTYLLNGASASPWQLIKAPNPADLGKKVTTTVSPSGDGSFLSTSTGQ